MNLIAEITHSDLARLAQRVSTLESFQNQTLVFIIAATFFSGLAIGFIAAKYFHKEQKKEKTYKW